MLTVDPNCDLPLTAASNYWCQNCCLENIKQLKVRIAEGESDQGPRADRFKSDEWNIPKDKYFKKLSTRGHFVADTSVFGAGTNCFLFSNSSLVTFAIRGVLQTYSPESRVLFTFS